MTKVKLFYTIGNCGDGSAAIRFHEDKEAAQIACDIEEASGEGFAENYPESVELEFDANGKLINPSLTKKELLSELAEIRGEDEEEPAAGKSQETSATSDGQTTKIKLVYTLRNCGDGSAAALFHEDEEAAQIACDIEEEYGEPFNENYPETANLEFDASGKLLNPSQTKEELRGELAEEKSFREEQERNKPPMNTHLLKLHVLPAIFEDKDGGNDTYLRDQFRQVTKTPSATELKKTADITGKTVVFTGAPPELRTQATQQADKLGIRIADDVSTGTNILVVGNDTDEKLDKAVAAGATILFQQEWKDIISRASKKQASASNRFRTAP